MSDPDPNPPAGRLSARAAAVLQVIVDEGGRDGPVAAPLSLLIERTGVARSTLQLGLADLAASGLVDVTADPGRRKLYRVLAEGTDRTDIGVPIDRPDRTDIGVPNRPDSDRPDAEIPSRGRADGPPSPPPSRPPTTAPVAGDASERAGGSDRPDAQTGPTEGDVVEPGQAVVAWAVDEQRRLDKPKLDGALLGRIGSVAKRMLLGGVSVVDLKLAAETLVQRDMTDLQAAHRAAQAGSGSLVSTRATGTEMERLSVEAAASRATRDRSHLGSHDPAQLVEVWWYLAWQWGRVYAPAEQAAWSEMLRPLPIGGILWALDRLAKGGEHTRWPPTCGEVYRVALPEVLDRRLQRKLRRDAEASE